jgi:ATP-binding cassette subfamily B multidrug efflux pump
MARQITNAKPRDMMKTLSSFKKYMGNHKYALLSVS